MNIPEAEIAIQLINLDASSRPLKFVGSMPDEIIEDCINHVSTYLS